MKTLGSLALLRGIFYFLFIHTNPPQEIPQKFRKFRWAFRAYPLRVDPQRPQICGGVVFGIFICSAGQRRGKRDEGDTEERGDGGTTPRVAEQNRNRKKRCFFNENDNIDVNEIKFSFFCQGIGSCV